jgi:hypothetical protein
MLKWWTGRIWEDFLVIYDMLKWCISHMVSVYCQKNQENVAHCNLNFEAQLSMEPPECWGTSVDWHLVQRRTFLFNLISARIERFWGIVFAFRT